MSDTPDMDAPVTRREMYEALETWAGAIIEKMTTAITELRTELRNALRIDLRNELRATERRLSAELRQHTKSSEDELATRLVAVDQQYTDLPARVTRLEAKVFAPSRRKLRPAAQPKRKRRS